MKMSREEGEARPPAITATELAEAIISVDAIKADHEGRETEIARSFNVDGVALQGASQVRHEVCSNALREYEAKYGGPVEDEIAVRAFWTDGFLIGLYLGHRLEEREDASSDE